MEARRIKLFKSLLATPVGSPLATVAILTRGLLILTSIAYFILEFLDVWIVKRLARLSRWTSR